MSEHRKGPRAGGLRTGGPRTGGPRTGQPLSAQPRLNYLIHDVSRMRRTLFDQALKPYGVTAAQWWLMSTLSRYNDTGMIQTELARAVESGKVGVGSLIERLVAAGLIERRLDGRDRRARRLFVTDAGLGVLEHIAIVAERLDLRVFAGLDDDRLNAAAQVLRVIKENLRCAMTTRSEEGAPAATEALLSWSGD